MHPFLVPKLRLGMPSATLRVARRRASLEWIPKQSLETSKRRKKFAIGLSSFKHAGFWGLICLSTSFVVLNSENGNVRQFL